jgi:hypothetical protein
MMYAGIRNNVKAMATEKKKINPGRSADSLVFATAACATPEDPTKGIVDQA